MTIAPKEFNRDPFRKRRKPVKSVALLASYKRKHEFCLVCGKPGEVTIHHILGGRAGRSDEHCNLFSCCLRPCHLDFADHSRNTGIVLAMKERAGELTQSDLDRLTELADKRLPDLAEIPEPYRTSYETNMQLRRAA